VSPTRPLARRPVRRGSRNGLVPPAIHFISSLSPRGDPSTGTLLADSLPFRSERIDSDGGSHDTGASAPGDGIAAEDELPRWLRLLLLLIGGGFLLVGIVMLALPVLPQVWAFAMAGVCFSLASETVWRWTERHTRRWPRVHATTCRLRTGILSRLPRRRRS